MPTTRRLVQSTRVTLAAALAAGALVYAAHQADAQLVEPTLTDPNLRVRTAVSGLSQPVSLAFIGPSQMLVVEKATGRVQHVVNGAIQGTAVDLAVNSASERGLLGI